MAHEQFPVKNSNVHKTVIQLVVWKDILLLFAKVIEILVS